MNVLILTNMYPNQKVKWAGTFVEQQVLSLQQQPGLELDVFVIAGSATGGRFLNYFLGYIKLLNKLYFSKKKYDLVHSHHYFMTLLYKMTFKKIPIIYTMHENNYYQTNSFTRTIIGWCARNSTATLVVWHKMLKLFHHHKTHFMASGIDIDIFTDEDKLTARKTLNIETDKTYIFFPAPQSRPEKNAKFLTDFISNNPEFIKQHNIAVIWGGNIAYSDMPITMNAADILLSLSDYESDGMTFKEAMACNLPVITFDVGNSQLYFDDQKSGTIISPDEDSLKQSIIYWLDNISTGRDKLLQLGMDSNTVAVKIARIYQDVVNSSAKKTR